MSDQMYRLADSWNVDEWPYDFSTEGVGQLNEIAPLSYSYVLWKAYGDTRVELYEYVGEMEVDDE